MTSGVRNSLAKKFLAGLDLPVPALKPEPSPKELLKGVLVASFEMLSKARRVFPFEPVVVNLHEMREHLGVDVDKILGVSAGHPLFAAGAPLGEAIPKLAMRVDFKFFDLSRERPEFNFLPHSFLSESYRIKRAMEHVEQGSTPDQAAYTLYEKNLLGQGHGLSFR